ncbi:hypothetical protein [Paenibacillus brevis]|uniref:Uncharacterized protein n=1 Tax=Paenibacillus brevis TaxID=2841508 RepID=A0ABS6FQT5_9BACL|nr:hypothetical protein [Paenibacillus brevis]MBU5671803.1 hypothetical protein [Paenibacillus brevis]
MKRILSTFIVVISLSLVMSPSIFANPSPQSQINDEEIKLLHSQTYDLVIQGKEDAVESLPLVKKYKEIFEQNPELYIEYLSKLDIYNNEQINNHVDNVHTYTVEGNRVTRMPDGSFIIQHQSLKNDEGVEIKPQPITDDIRLMDILQDTGWQKYTNPSGHNFTNDARHDFWGVWKTQELHLVTKGKISMSDIEITSTSTVGTNAWFPGKIESQSSSVITNNSKNVKSSGEYTITGIIKEITYSKTIGITTELRWDGLSSRDVKYSIRSVVEGSL